MIQKVVLVFLFRDAVNLEDDLLCVNIFIYKPMILSDFPMAEQPKRASGTNGNMNDCNGYELQACRWDDFDPLVRGKERWGGDVEGVSMFASWRLTLTRRRRPWLRAQLTGHLISCTAAENDGTQT
nr:unnamed protein product [Callosobruchus analis]